MADLDLARRDLGAFSRVVGWPLTRWQADALELEAHVSVCVAPRQSGKSRSLAVLALHRAFRHAGHRVLIVSAGEEAARRLLAEVRRIATGSPLLRGSLVDETAGLLTLTNGSEVRSVPASERQIRGWSVDLLLVDEAALVSDDLLLGAAFPTTAARPDARIVLASSAVTAAGAFYDHAMRGQAGSEHVRTFRWALADAEWISPSVIEAARESMTPTRFAAEYLGEFASGQDALFSRATLDAATADIVVPGFRGLAGPARMLGGVDWGATTDRSALVAIGRLVVEGAPVFAVTAAHAWRSGHPLDGPGGVIGEIADSPALFDRLSAETNGLGLPCSQELERRMRQRRPELGGGAPPGSLPPLAIWTGDREKSWRERQRAQNRLDLIGAFRTNVELVHTTAEMKAATYATLRLLMDRGLLVLPASAEELLRELLLLRVEMLPSGSERIEASTGHDDVADALMLAAGPYRARSGAWRSRLGDLLDPGYSLPHPHLGRQVGDAQLDRATGAGRRLPRVPALQSVAGPHVSTQLPATHPASAMVAGA